MWKSAASLKQDVARWQTAGWVTPDGARAIAAEIDSRTRSLSAASVFGILGAVLFAFAAMSFVAANWQEMSKLFRIVLLIGAMAGAYGLAGLMFQRGLPAFGHAAVLLGSCLFGANIMLISQMYHIDGHPPDAILVWAIGAIVAGVLIGSNPALALALVLLCVWSGFESATRAEVGIWQRVSLVHWPLPIALAGMAGLFTWRGWRPGLEMCAIAMTGWVILLGYLLAGAPQHGVTVAIGLLVAAVGAWLVRAKLDGAPAEIAHRMVLLGAVAVFAGLYMGQFHHGRSAAPFGIWAAVMLATTAAAIWFGLQYSVRNLVRLAYVAFAIEIVTIYFKTVGSLIGSAGFFLTAGLLMIGLAVLALRLERLSAAGRTPAEVAP